MIIKNYNDDLLDLAWPREDGTFDLREANLSGADLRGANLYILGQCTRGYAFLLHTKDEPCIQAGCHDFTLTEARQHWESAHADNPVLQAQCLGFVATAEAIVAAIANQ